MLHCEICPWCCCLQTWWTWVIQSIIMSQKLNSPPATNFLYMDASITGMPENTLAMPCLDFFVNPCPLLHLTHYFVCTFLCPVLVSHTWHIHLQAQSDKVNEETCMERLDPVIRQKYLLDLEQERKKWYSDFVKKAINTLTTTTAFTIHSQWFRTTRFKFRHIIVIVAMKEPIWTILLCCCTATTIVHENIPFLYEHDWQYFASWCSCCLQIIHLLLPYGVNLACHNSNRCYWAVMVKPVYEIYSNHGGY